jgi:hypothetical protein
LAAHRESLTHSRAELEQEVLRLQTKLETLKKWTDLETESMLANRIKLAAARRQGAAASPPTKERLAVGDVLLDEDRPLLSEEDLRELDLLDEPET